MATFVSYLLAYLLGGLTFLPILLLAFLYHAYLTQPVVDPTTSHRDPLALTTVEEDIAQEELKGLPSEISPRAHEPDVASGYFAVSREYVAGGVDGKPPEKSASQTSSVNGESPSVYQSMYRTIFERGKPQIPTLGTSTKGSKKPRNVFFVVIRLGLLMLYDDEEQIEVRHVISLEHYDVHVYAGGDPIPEGELWVKRNCIRMSRKENSEILPPDTKPYFLFSNNCSEKEDFYHAMLQNQARHGISTPASQPLTFEGEHMVKLIRQLHASEDDLQTRWINALIGRIFLSMYKTSLVEQFVRKKINKKLSRVPKPAFITAIQIRNIHLGDSGPFITGPKLRELTRDGDLTLEADMKYKGNARIDVAAVARIDLGTRFKPREVQLLLAIICKGLEGHVYFRVKPPPSNRMWFSFVGMPKLDLSVEPVISSRQITYSLVLKAIESRIREVINDTLVYPNWDDAPFFNTLDHEIRGGIWRDDSSEALNATLSAAPTLVEGGDEVPMPEDEHAEETAQMIIAETDGESSTKSQGAKLHKRKNRGASASKPNAADASAISSSVDPVVKAPPKAIRSNSFATAASPVVTKDSAVMEAMANLTRTGGLDATLGLKDISSRSQPSTPSESPIGSPNPGGMWKRRNDRSMSTTSKRSGSDGDATIAEEAMADTASIPRSGIHGEPSKDSDNASVITESSSMTNRSGSLHKRQTIASTAAAAKKWGLGFVTRQSPSNSVSGAHAKEEANHEDPSQQIAAKLASFKDSRESLGANLKNQPMGRGQPLPPPGQPLPGPKNRMTWAGPLLMLGRKKTSSELNPLTTTSPAPSTPASATPADLPPGSKDLESPQLPPRPRKEAQSPGMDGKSRGSSLPRPVKPKLPARPEETSENGRADEMPQSREDEDSLLVIRAPEGETDAESLLSGSPTVDEARSPEVSRSHHPSPALHDTLAADAEEDYSATINLTQNDSHDTPLPFSTEDLLSTDASNTTSPTSPTPLSTSTSTRHRPDPSTTPIPRPSSIPSPASQHSAFEAHKPRKARSRQSLIPTPTSSRKTSPAQTSARARSVLGHRASAQELREPEGRRASSGVRQKGREVEES